MVAYFIDVRFRMYWNFLCGHAMDTSCNYYCLCLVALVHFGFWCQWPLCMQTCLAQMQNDAT